MKKVLSEEQFEKAVNDLDIGNQALRIAYGVLVKGRPQIEFAKQFGVTRGAISQTVNRVWNARQDRGLPDGYEKVSVVLSERQAYIVKKWAKDTANKLDKKL